MYPDYPELLAGMMECYKTHRTLQSELDHRLVSTGEVRTLSATTGFITPDLVLVHLADLSTRKGMERDLRTANDDLNRVLEAMGEGVVVLDADGRMTRLNKKACELFGRSEEEILGHDYSFWTPPDSRDLLASEHRKRRRGVRSAYDALLVRDDGTPFWAHITAVPVIGEGGEFQGSVGCLRDITREKKARGELRKLHNFNRQLIKTAGVWINVTDKDGNITLWNDEAEKTSGYSRDEVMGNDRIWEWLYPDAEYRAKIKRGQREMNVDKSSSQRNETVIRCKAGEERAIQWYGRPRYGAGGQLDGWVIAGHDVTGTKHNLQRLRDYAAQVERLSREKTRFVSVASHELRTPLTIVRGFIDLLSETEPRANQRQILERIQAQLDRFTSLLDDLLDVSRIDAGESNLTLAVVDLEEITRQVLELLSPQAVAKGLSVKIADGPSPVIAYADSGSVMQIVTNVLLNAISYTRDGGSISVAVSSRSSKAEILISDTGIGIRDDEQELIFGEFHRTERARKMKANGNGLGLAIVRRLLSEMNGEIWVRSAGENMGTTVSITLPVSAEGAEKEMADADTDL
jgi:protein-histidine pros-kinase